MSTSIEQFDEGMRRKADRLGTTVVHRGELLRHPVWPIDHLPLFAMAWECPNLQPDQYHRYLPPTLLNEWIIPAQFLTMVETAASAC